MNTNSNQGQRARQTDKYGGYQGYTPPSSANDDPYGSTGAGARQSDSTYTYGQQGGQRGQSSYTYQPPLSANRGKDRTNANTSSTQNSDPTIKNARARQFAALSYLGVCFTGLFFFFYRRKNRFVRFHAAQSITLFTPALLIYWLLTVIKTFVAGFPLIGWLVGGAVGLVILALSVIVVLLWLFLMITALLGVTVRIPIASRYADRLVARFTPRY